MGSPYLRLIKVLNCNARGLGLPKKRRMIKELVHTEQIDILCVRKLRKNSLLIKFLSLLL
jgi:hypothetical protein